ncbi:23S rRNA (adenine(2503)-C(2))-methyltransferase RlmN [Tessaracoccus flavus]|uniref:Probable dual-specificity RNA methyltransferase RlmN n=1 Tax=Tessaracoccus flavus TaxID=1610493 RepID=A0A1Q2CDH5_9ACTN|nr:23S rRNA (adenine(2503)-C(2))-methyltransferase RlmN [Tessaracoccus flavus]AQP44168.1 23S rRNA (adenine(2503)-C(2))-methyltransferase RlmN [Tessaracoccus flavus]SDY37142.1 23S rRNA m(2)A-2503 methyltransferase [Tessaracoccus flavus]
MSGSPLPLVFDAPARGKAPKHWLDLTPDERRETAEKLGLPRYRADQISRHVFDRLEDDATHFTDLPAAIREDLAEQIFPSLLERVTTRTADKGATVKTLWKLHDGSLLESVLMRYPNRSTLCISSQAGCGMACPFCATGQGGLKRNLSQAEITIQALAANQMLTRGEVPGTTGRLNNIVFMGMGEPLANYRAVLGSIRTLLAPSPDGFGMSARGITVSTVGLVPQIRKLTEEELPLTLAVSLHAPDDELRDEIVPVNNRWKVAEVVDAAWDYARTTKRRVSIEYAMMRDINDQVSRAHLLADILKRRGDWGWVHVNLIPLNPTPGSKWTASRKEDERAFVATLERRGVPVTLRDTRGSEIDGACGQLAATVEAS